MKMGWRTAAMLSACLALSGCASTRPAMARVNRIPAAETIMGSRPRGVEMPKGRLALFPKKVEKEREGTPAPDAQEKGEKREWALGIMRTAGIPEEKQVGPPYEHGTDSGGESLNKGGEGRQKEKPATPTERAGEKAKSGTGLLDSIDAEFTHMGYERVGSVTGGRVRASRGPLSLEVGAGAQELEYYKTLFFVTPKLEIRGIVGDTELYGSWSVPIMPNSATVISWLGDVGAVWEPVRGHRGASFRMGTELESIGEVDTGRSFTKMGIGVALAYGDAKIYVIEEVSFPYQKIYSRNRYTLNHHRARAGVAVGGKGGMRVEAFKGNFDEGFELSFRFPDQGTEKEVYGWYSKAWDILGGSSGGIGFRGSFGGKRGKVGARFERGVAEGNLADSRITRYRLKEGTWKEKRKEFFRAVIGSENIRELADKYRGRGDGEVLAAVHLLGIFAHVNYEMGPDEWIAGLGAEGAFRAVRRYIKTEEYGGGGVCANISALQATFLREAGWEAYSGELLTPYGVGHTVAVAKNPKSEETYLMGIEGSIKINGRGGIWPLIRKYSIEEFGIVPTRIALYGEGNRIVGYYEAEEGKMKREISGDSDTLRDALLHSRP